MFSFQALVGIRFKAIGDLELDEQYLPVSTKQGVEAEDPDSPKK